MSRTAIEWTDESWNPVTGCLKGCGYCFARGFAKRLSRKPTLTPEARARYEGFRPAFWPERLEEPTRLKRPRKIFVCSMADLFGRGVEAAWIDQVFQAALKAPQHTYQFLTKHPSRLVDAVRACRPPRSAHWWAGVTVESDLRAGRIRKLLELKGSVEKLYVSAEPLLAPLDVAPYVASDCPTCEGSGSVPVYERGLQAGGRQCPTCRYEWRQGMGLDWVIVGPETGPKLRETPPGVLGWARKVRDDCRAAGVAFFYKGKNAPEDLRIQEFPESVPVRERPCSSVTPSEKG